MCGVGDCVFGYEIEVKYVSGIGCVMFFGGEVVVEQLCCQCNIQWWCYVVDYGCCYWCVYLVGD